MHLFIASLVLLAFVAAAQAQGRDFSALVPAPAVAPGANHARSPQTDAGASRRDDGFSGSFDVRQTVRNLGY